LAVIQLATRRNQTLKRLRLLEAIVFAGILLFFIENDIRGLIKNRDIFPNLWALHTNASALQYALLIVCYGVLIPNPWRRCAAGVGIIVTCAYVASTIGFVLAPQPIGIIAAYFAQLTIWLGIAGVIVIYGAYRIEILRDQAERGRELGQYRLQQLLGSGGMGEVYLAAHRLLRRPCAIKLIHPEQAGDVQNLSRFEREVQVTATLTHPNTIQIYDYGHTEDGTFYYVMEYLDGLTLEDMAKSYGPLPSERVIHLLRQVCSALGEAHAIGLIHRDIKPGNVMICQRGGIADVVKLLDFGLVLPLAKDGDGERLSQSGAISGTPAYMSPEQVDARENLDPRSDIYSLGALAYFALTGESPFAGRSPVKMMAAHLYEQPTPLVRHRPEVAVDLEAIVLRCLAKDPEGRFPDVESLETALAKCQCAGQWSKKDASSWWRSHIGRDD
jgi:eukaryotic-like serine/threonine-protein kinase